MQIAYEKGENECGEYLKNVEGMLLFIYGLLTKHEVKMAGYWPSSFFACLWTEAELRSINSQKKNEANIQPS